MTQLVQEAETSGAPPALEVGVLAEEFESRPAQDVIGWALDTFGRRAALVTGLQAEGLVILDMAHRIDPNVRVITVDTGRLPQETYDLLDRVRDHYGISVEVLYPDPTRLTRMVTQHGINLFYRDVALRMSCCDIRKVEPLGRALQDMDAWMTGLRRSQAETRAAVAKVQVDHAHGRMVKVNPLADWSLDRVWQYVREHHVPYNTLYDQGYTSIGCGPCTRAVRPDEDIRSGRWWWEQGAPKECGMHLDPALRSTA